MKQEIANIIQLPKIFDPRGNLTVAEEQKNIPFHIKHVEWRYGMPAGTSLEQDITIQNWYSSLYQDPSR